MKKTCTRCKRKLPLKDFGVNKRSSDGLSYVCRECHNKQTRESHRRNYKKNPEKHRQRSREWVQKNYKKAQDMWRVHGKKYRDALREKVLIHYGGKKPKCACCQESNLEFLSLDHVNGSGGKQRRELKNKVFPWIVKNNFPKGFQVLCHNCNLAKGFYGYCPHEKNITKV